MTLQSSGSISLSQVQSEMGGTNPISMSEYYLGGSFVPTSVTTPAGSWSSYYGNGSYTWNADIFATMVWNGVTISPQFMAGTVTETTIGGYNYQRGTQWDQVTTGSGKSSVTTTKYTIRRRLAEATITVNTGVPTSGSIDMTDFYDGRKT